MARLEKKRDFILTPHQVAELLMVSPVTVRHWAQKGELKALSTPGGHRRFARDEVERFARQYGLALAPHISPGLRILVVDDEPPLRRYLCELLEPLDDVTAVEIAADGFEAGHKVHKFRPNLILLDLMMPGLDGFEVCRMLKDDPETKTIRIIAMTGYMTAENIARIRLAGAEGCIPKPFEAPELFKLMGIRALGE